MGKIEIIQKIVKDTTVYCIYEVSGFPYCITENNIIIDAQNTLLSKIHSTELNRWQNHSMSENICDDEPLMVVFYSFNAPSIHDDLALFNRSYANKLDCSYVIGHFNNFSAQLSNEIEYMKNEKCFSIALFNKSKEEVIDFAVSYIQDTKRVGALVVKKGKRGFHIRIEHSNFLDLQLDFQKIEIAKDKQE